MEHYNFEQVLLRYEDPGEFLLGELHNLHDKSIDLMDQCDVKLICKDNVIVQCHSSVLAIVSPYMRSILSDMWNVQQGVSVMLPDFQYVFICLLLTCDL